MLLKTLLFPHPSEVFAVVDLNFTIYMLLQFAHLSEVNTVALHVGHVDPQQFPAGRRVPNPDLSPAARGKQQGSPRGKGHVLHGLRRGGDDLLLSELQEVEPGMWKCWF